jgi:excinuclease ABC subunit A
VVDLGPEGGEGGGEIVAMGTPEQIAQTERSHTGKYLFEVLARAQATAPLKKGSKNADASV